MFKFIKNISIKSVSRVDLVEIYGIRHVLKTYNGTQKEIQILKICNHPNIIRYLDILHVDPECTILVFPLEMISLTNLITNYMYDQWGVIKQIVEGLHYLHSNRILHLDLKSDNIMYTGGHVKIIDMGSSEIGEKVKVNVPKCTLTHRPPEGYYHGNSYVVDKYFDMWSLGIIIFEVLGGVPMYLAEIFPAYRIGMADAVYERMVRSIEFRERVKEELPEELKRCLELEPMSRLDIRQIFEFLS